jgi:hypothetical protein
MGFLFEARAMCGSCFLSQAWSQSDGPIAMTTRQILVQCKRARRTAGIGFLLLVSSLTERQFSEFPACVGMTFTLNPKFFLPITGN